MRAWVGAAAVHPDVLGAGGQVRAAEVGPLRVDHHAVAAPAVPGRELGGKIGGNGLAVGAVGAWGKHRWEKEEDCEVETEGDLGGAVSRDITPASRRTRQRPGTAAITRPHPCPG